MRSSSLLPVLSLALLLLLTAAPALGRTPAEWKTRSIYQIITDRFAPTIPTTTPCRNIRDYCGGTYQGLISRLDYIADLGFNAIWISPIPLNPPRSFHGYGAIDLYTLNDHFGSVDDLKALTAACHARDIWVMVDVVGNHMASFSNNISTFKPFNLPEHYHDCQGGCDSQCNIPDSAWPPHNATVIEHCRLEGLADLDQDHPYVRATLLDWIKSIVTNYSFDGLRVDTTPEVKKPFWQEWNAAAGVYAFGEVFDSDVVYVASFQGAALDATLSYPVFFMMRSCFAQRQSLVQLQTLYSTYSAQFKDPTILGTFADNHDNARFLSLTNDSALYLNALTYTLTSRGVPIVYYGSEQGFYGQTDPYDREPLWTTNYTTTSTYYQHLKALNRWRNTTQPWLDDTQVWVAVTDSYLVFTRAGSLVVVNNLGSKGAATLDLTGVALADGSLVNVWDASDKVTVQGGKVSVKIVNGLPMVYAPSKGGDGSTGGEGSSGGEASPVGGASTGSTNSAAGKARSILSTLLHSARALFA